MALIKCSECGRDVSDKAISCPACGNPIAQLPKDDAKASAAQSGKKKYTTKEWAVSWGLSALIIFLAFALNPSEERHRTALRSALEQQEPISKYFGISHLTALSVKYENYGFMSVTRDGSRNVTLGLYGYVHVFNLDSAQ